MEIEGNCRFCKTTKQAAAVAFALLAIVAFQPVAAQQASLREAPVVEQSPAAPVQSASSLSPEEMGDLMMVRKRYEAATQSYLLVSPKSSQVWNKLGIAYQQMYNTELARKCYKTSLKINSKNPNVMNNLGTIYYSLNQYDVAEHWYRKALKLDPKSALIHKNLGTALLAEDQFKKGWESYQTALAIDPNIFERANQLRIGEPTPPHRIGAMNYFLAKSYASAGMPELAVQYLRKAIDEGFVDRKRLLADKEFASLHGFSAFERLLAEQSLQ